MIWPICIIFSTFFAKQRVNRSFPRREGEINFFQAATFWIDTGAGRLGKGPGILWGNTSESFLYWRAQAGWPSIPVQVIVLKGDPGPGIRQRRHLGNDFLELYEMLGNACSAKVFFKR